MRAVLVLVMVIGVGCLRDTQFRCESNAECGAGGRCELVGFCSFPDGDCAGTGFRFGESAGPLANTCVGSDGGIDGGVDSIGQACPTDYVAVGTRKFKLVAAPDDWIAAQAACVATSPDAYLAIPDDAAELTAQMTIAANKHWIGVSDQIQEGVFQNVKGMSAFGQFDTGNGEPDNQGNQDCVAVTGTLMSTEQCDLSLPYLCECDD